MPRFKAEEFDTYAKSISVSGPVYFDIDNDDVGPGNRLLAEHLVAILNKHWTDLEAYYCDNDDCDDVGMFLRDNEVERPGLEFSDELSIPDDTALCPTCRHDLTWGTVDA
jgi:hypothetical protein